MLSGLPEDGGARGQVGKMGLPAQALETWVLRVGPLLSAAYLQDRVPRAGVSLCSGSSGPGGLCSCPSDLDKRVCSQHPAWGSWVCRPPPHLPVLPRRS